MSKKYEKVQAGLIAFNLLPFMGFYSLYSEKRFGCVILLLGLVGAVSMLFSLIVDEPTNYRFFGMSEGVMIFLMIFGAWFMISGDRYRIKCIRDEIEFQKKWKRLKAMEKRDENQSEVQT